MRPHAVALVKLTESELGTSPFAVTLRPVVSTPIEVLAILD